MIWGILLILGCVPLFVVNSFCDKIASTKNGNRYNYFYNALKFLICTICMLPVLLLDDAPICAWGCILCGVICGIAYAINKTVILKGYQRTSVAFMTLCHASGMILPCILGHFLWSERLGVVSLLGIAFVILSIVLLKGGQGESMKADDRGVFFGISIFLTSATVMITQKCMGIYFPEQSVGAYNLYSFIVPFCILGCLIKPVPAINDEKKAGKSLWIYALGSGVSLSVISFVMTSLSGSVPSVVLFPLFNGLGIILVCIGSAFAFQEKITLKKGVGLAIGVLGLCFVNF